MKKAVFRHKKTGISQPIAVHGKELNSHTTESIISYVLFTSYICGDNIQENKKVSQNILVYMNKCLKNSEKNILNIVPTDFRRRMKFNSPEDVKNYIEKKRMIMNQYNAVQEIEPSM